MKKYNVFVVLLLCLLFIPNHAQAKFQLSNLSATNDFHLKTIDGKEIHLNDLKGKQVILNFFTTWCPACKEELSDLNKFQEKYGKEVNFLSINYTAYEIGKNERILEYIKRNQINFPVLLDISGKVGKSFEVITIPTTIFIDKNGNIIKKNVGPVTFNDLESFVLENN